jgi:hypothetical protein
MTEIIVQKKSGPGGARPGAGRKKGTPNKYSAISLLEEITKADKPFEVGLAEDYANARKGDDKHLIHKYQSMLLNKIVPDRTAVDMTTAGQALGVHLTFAPKSLDDWK